MSAARAWHALTAAVALVALVLQLVLVINGGRVLVGGLPADPWAMRLLRFVAYFTVAEQPPGAGHHGALARDPAARRRRWRVVRTPAISGITVTGLVHWFLLRPLLAPARRRPASPTGCCTSSSRSSRSPGWLVFGPRPRIAWPGCLRAAVWPLALAGGDPGRRAA